MSKKPTKGLFLTNSDLESKKYEVADYFLKPTMKRQKLKQINLETKIGDLTFVPILELCYIALQDIYGDNCEKDCTSMVEVYNDKEIGFGVVTHYFDSRVGFSLNLEKGWKEFQLSIDDSKHMKLDQLKLFDKLREWGFEI